MSAYPTTWASPPPVATVAEPRGPAVVATGPDDDDDLAFAQAQRIRILKMQRSRKTTGKTAAELWPKAQAKIRDLALRGMLTETHRKEAEWLGFELPGPEERYPKKPMQQYQPPVAPQPSAEDTAALAAGAHGPATVEQIYALPPNSPLRQAYDTALPAESRVRGYVVAGGRKWWITQHAWGREGTELSERTIKNGERRAEAELKRVNKRNKANKLPPLAAEFYGQTKDVLPRYRTADEANAHETNRRKEWLEGMRDGYAQRVREIRLIIHRQDEDTIARWYTTWQLRRWGKDVVNLLSFLHQKEKELLTGVVEPVTIPVSQARRLG